MKEETIVSTTELDDVDVEETTNTDAVDDTAETSEDSQSAALSLADVHALNDEELDEFLQNNEMPQDGEEEEASDDEASDSDDSTDDDNVEDDPDTDDDDDDAETPNDVGTIEDLLQPFKANGRDMTIDNVEEARRLMQQGINYSKNMAEFAPYKKAMKLLKSKDALDPEKLSFLLDVAEGKPEAVAKLLQDQNIDPYDIDVNKGEDYKSDYEDTETIDNLSDIIDSLPTGDAKIKTLELLSENGWDAQSKTEIYQNPESIRILNNQIQSGVHDQIMSAVDKRRALGDLVSLSDIDAYNKVGKELETQGKLGVPNTPNESTISNSTTIKANKGKSIQRKKAANAPRKAPSNAPDAKPWVPAIASDEEIDKFIEDQLNAVAR